MSSNSREEDVLEGYRGKSLEILRRAGARVGSTVLIKTLDGFQASGLLIPRYERSDDNYIVLKLKSGYNLGIEASDVDSVSIMEQPREEKKETHPRMASKSDKKVLLLSTGGTIASRVDYRTGAVHPALSAEDLYTAVPELGEIAWIQPEVVFSTYSENLTPLDWEKLAKRIASIQAPSNFDGIVVMLGTDTLAYFSAALGFALIGLDFPVVCVGAQRSSDRPSSDSAVNLKAAVRFAAYSKMNGVFVAMHKNMSDESVAIHQGARVRKNHTSRRDAFESIGIPQVAEVRGSEIIQSKLGTPGSSEERFRLRTRFEPNVSLLKFHPGFDPGVLDYLDSRKMRGMIIEGTGLGHVSSRNVEKIAQLSSSGVFVGVASQCIWGRVDLNVYDTGRDLVAAGAVPLEDMLGETAFAKLSWALGNFPPDETREIMRRNLVGEITFRTPAV